MKILAVDLSLRSTGICYLDEKEVLFETVSDKKLEDEILIIHNVSKILSLVNHFRPDVIAIESLSFASISGSKDKLAGQLWHFRIELKKQFPDLKIVYVPVLSWRSPLFNKEERKQMTIYKQDLADLKKAMKGCNKTERTALTRENEHIILGADIKHQTYLKLPEEIIKKIKDEPAKYDLCDAYFIAKFIESQK